MADRDAPDAGLLIDGARARRFGDDRSGAQPGHWRGVGLHGAARRWRRSRSDRGRAAIFNVFDNAGQDCCLRSRVLVERPVYAEFVERYVERIHAAALGASLAHRRWSITASRTACLLQRI